MTDATKVPKWAMDCAKLLRQFYEPYRKFNACRGDYENVPDSDVAAIIAAAAPDYATGGTGTPTMADATKVQEPGMTSKANRTVQTLTTEMFGLMSTAQRNGMSGHDAIVAGTRPFLERLLQLETAAAPDYATGGTGTPTMADATKVPKWAMDCAKLLRQFYEPYRKFNACRGDYENVPDSDVAAIIAAAAPDELAIQRATVKRIMQIAEEWPDDYTGLCREIRREFGIGA